MLASPLAITIFSDDHILCCAAIPVNAVYCFVCGCFHRIRIRIVDPDPMKTTVAQDCP